MLARGLRRESVVNSGAGDNAVERDRQEQHRRIQYHSGQPTHSVNTLDELDDSAKQSQPLQEQDAISTTQPPDQAAVVEQLSPPGPTPRLSATSECRSSATRPAPTALFKAASDDSLAAQQPGKLDLEVSRERSSSSHSDSCHHGIIA